MESIARDALEVTVVRYWAEWISTLSLEINGLEDVWGPHNSILLLWLNYGIIGVLFYFVYCFSILQSVREVGRFDQEGNNVFVLLCILLFFIIRTAGWVCDL